MDPRDAICRYFYLRTFNHHFVNRTEDAANLLVVSQIPDYLQKLVDSFDAMSGVDLAKRAIQSKTLSRKDEVFRVLAYFIQKLDTISTQPDVSITKHEIFENLPEMFETDDDLLLFVSKFNKLGKPFHFGHGMRRSLTKWYLSKTALELSEMFAKTKSAHKISHKSVLTNIHITSPDPAQREILTINFVNGSQIKAKPDASVAYKTYYEYHKLKVAEPLQVLEILNRKEYNYQLYHLPSKGIKDPAVWSAILPNLSTKKILDMLLKLNSYNLLKVHEPFSRKLCEFLGDFQNIGSDKLNPLEIFFLARSYENKSKVIDTLSEEMKKKEGATCSAGKTCINAAGKTAKVDKKAICSNPYIVKKLYGLLNYSIGQQDRTGVKYFVTIDFRKFSSSHGKIFNHRSILCAEAQIVAALTWLKTEKEVSLMSFTSDPDQLKPIAFNQETTFEKALGIYEKEIISHPKTKQKLAQPLKQALDDKIKVDVFITIVDSIARTLGKDVRPPFEALHTYRKGMNIKTAKYVIINLCRKTPDFKYDDKIINNNGILEINGIGPETFSVIEAFARNLFE